MKYIITSLIFLLCLNVYAQEEIPQEKIFLRVYNLKGKKICKGKVFSVSDSFLKLNLNNKITQISFEEIGYVKTKRSAGHNALMGASIGTTLGMIGSSGESSYIPDAVGIGILTTGGGLLGLLTWSSKNYYEFEINGNLENFKQFKETIIGKN